MGNRHIGRLVSQISSVKLLLLNLAFFGIWVVLYFIVPKNWTGFMDGFFYQLLIKNFLFDIFPKDVNLVDIFYPYYFYYFISQVGTLLGIQNVNLIYLLSGGLSILVPNMINYLLLKKVFGKKLSILITFIIFFLLLIYDPGIIIRKPHETFTFLAAIGLSIKYIYQDSVNQRVFFSVLYGVYIGFLIGSYTILGLLPISIILFSLVISKTKEWKSFALTTFIALLISLPSTFQIFIGLSKYNKNIPFLLDGYNLNNYFFFYGLILVTILGVYLPEFDKRKILLAISPLVLYATTIFLIPTGLIIQTPGRIASFGAVLITMVLIIEIFSQKLDFKRTILNNSYNSKVFFVVLFSFLILIQRFVFSAPEDLRSSILISNSRNSNNELNSIVDYLNNFKKDENVRLLANMEFRFVQFYVNRNTIILPIVFNEGWVSPSTNMADNFASLKSEIENGDSVSFLEWLDKNDIDLIILKKDSITGYYPIESLIYRGFPYDETSLQGIKLEERTLVGLTKLNWEEVNVPDCNCTILKR